MTAQEQTKDTPPSVHGAFVASGLPEAEAKEQEDEQ